MSSIQQMLFSFNLDSLLQAVTPERKDTPMFDSDASLNEIANNQLTKSWSMHNQVKNEIFHCEHQDCTKYFKSRLHLIAHARIHAGQKPFDCSKCNKAFSRKYDLERHEKSLHTKHRPFQCKGCNLSFSRVDSLKKHNIAEIKRGSSSHSLVD